MPSEENRLERKDVLFASAAGFFIGLLLLPILRASKPDLYEKVFLLTIPFFLIATPLGLIIAYHISKKFAFVWQLGKFGVTGVLNALVDLGILSLLTFIFSSYFQIEASTEIFAGIAFLTFYSFYKSVSFIIANINSFYWNKYWTFKQADNNKKTEFIQFFIVSLVGFVINVSVSSLVFHLSGAHGALSEARWGLLGAATGSIAGLAWNFIGYKYIVFKK